MADKLTANYTTQTSDFVNILTPHKTISQYKQVRKKFV